MLSELWLDRAFRQDAAAHMYQNKAIQHHYFAAIGPKLVQNSGIKWQNSGAHRNNMDIYRPSGPTSI